MHYDAIESNYVNKLFRTVESDMNVDSEFRESFAQRKVEFYEEYVDNVDEIVAVQSNYQKRHEKIVTERYIMFLFTLFSLPVVLYHTIYEFHSHLTSFTSYLSLVLSIITHSWKFVAFYLH